MKKNLLICIAHLILSFVVFTTIYFTAQRTNFLAIYNSGNEFNESELIRNFVFVQNGKSAQQMFNAIKPVLDRYDANIYTVCFSDNGKVMSKYVYCTQTGAFRSLLLANGRFLSQDEMQSEMYLSTFITSDAYQIGQIAGFSDVDFEIRTLYSNLDSDIFAGEFTLFMNDGSRLPDFLEDLEARGIRIVDTTSTVATATQGDPATNLYYAKLRWITVAITAAIMILVMFYSIINAFYKIGVEKLLGYGLVSIWKKRIPIIIVCETLISIAVISVGCACCFNAYSPLVGAFVIELVETNAIILVLSIALMSLPFIYVSRIKLSDVLKGRRPSALVTVFNVCVKLAMAVAVVSVAVGMYAQLTLLNSRYGAAYGNWENTKSYALLKGNMTGSLDYDPYSAENMSGFKSAYLEFNKAGAIWADFDAYMQNVKPGDAQTVAGFQIVAFVNPNYLEHYPVYGMDGKPVSVSENDDCFVLLIPEKYKNDEEQILSLHKNNAQQGQTIKIIWMRDHQAFFTYRIDIEPSKGNCIIDPVCIVVTESNMTTDWYSNIDSAALFVAVDNADNPSPEINAIMGKHFDINKVTFRVFGVYALINTQILATKQTIAFYSLILAVLFLLITIVTFQSVLNYFEQNKLRLTIQSCMGFKIVSKYRDIIAIVLLSYPIVSLASALINQKISAYILSLSVTIVEFVILYVSVRINERKSALRVIKGG